MAVQTQQTEVVIQNELFLSKIRDILSDYAQLHGGGFDGTWYTPQYRGSTGETRERDYRGQVQISDTRSCGCVVRIGNDGETAEFEIDVSGESTENGVRWKAWLEGLQEWALATHNLKFVFDAPRISAGGAIRVLLCSVVLAGFAESQTGCAIGGSGPVLAASPFSPVDEPGFDPSTARRLASRIPPLGSSQSVVEYVRPQPSSEVAYPSPIPRIDYQQIVGELQRLGVKARAESMEHSLMEHDDVFFEKKKIFLQKDVSNLRMVLQSVRLGEPRIRHDERLWTANLKNAWNSVATEFSRLVLGQSGPEKVVGVLDIMLVEMDALPKHVSADLHRDFQDLYGLRAGLANKDFNNDPLYLASQLLRIVDSPPETGFARGRLLIEFLYGLATKLGAYNRP